jgi:Icc-related predicted phosphoesterase
VWISYWEQEAMMRVYAVSDLHGYYPPYIPECETLLLGGDYCPTRDLEQERRYLLGKFKDWLDGLLLAKTVKRIIAIAGNHDRILETDRSVADALPWIYLQDSGVEIETIKFYGTPYTRTFYDWAFIESEDKLQERFKLIPEGLDILLTHGPAYGILDVNAQREHCGSPSLLYRIKEVKPDSVVCGHIHEGHGIMQEGKTRYYNVAYINGKYEPKYNCINIPIRME